MMGVLLATVSAVKAEDVSTPAIEVHGSGDEITLKVTGASRRDVIARILGDRQASVEKICLHHTLHDESLQPWSQPSQLGSTKMCAYDSGESRDPSLSEYGCSPRSHHADGWVAAFAGMTVFRVEQVLESGDQRDVRLQARQFLIQWADVDASFA